MAYTNIKTEIDGKIYTNILREITGDILNEVLKKMVDSLGKGYRYMGILEPDGSRPSGDENMFMIAIEAGYYTALANDVPSGITICSFSEGSIQVETILNLDEIFSGNHSWGGNNTFNGYTRFQNEVDVYFENMYDLEDGETLSGKLASLVTAIATKISKVTGAVEDNLATFDENGNVKDSGVSLADIDEKIDECAKKDGISEKLVSGSARGILSPSAIEELFLFQRTANGAGGTGAAVFQSIKGNSIVWNQILNLDNVSAFMATTITELTNGVRAVTTSQYCQPHMLANTALVTGHKYLFLLDLAITITANSSDLVLYDSDGSVAQRVTWRPQNGQNSVIFTFTGASSNRRVQPQIYSNTSGFTADYTNYQLIDLTVGQMADWTADLFRTIFPGYHAVTSLPVIKNNCATGMVTDGHNQWDEEYSKINRFLKPDGTEVTVVNNNISSYIPVVAGRTYYLADYPQDSLGVSSGFCWYDADKNFISGEAYAGATKVEMTAPTNASYLRFSVSTPANKYFFSLWSDTLALPITTATGKLNGEGESVVLCPDGARSAGSVYDEFVIEKGFITKFIKRIGVVDLGTLDWYKTGSGVYSGTFYASIPDRKSGLNILCGHYTTVSLSADLPDKCITEYAANDIAVRVKDTAYATAADFKAAMDGVMMNYELATEQLYVLDTPVPVVARVDENGTQTITPQGVDESGTPMTAPFKASIQYPVKLGVAPVGQQSLVNLLEKMKSAGKIASYTMVWDAANGAYDFTIS